MFIELVLYRNFIRIVVAHSCLLFKFEVVLVVFIPARKGIYRVSCPIVHDLILLRDSAPRLNLVRLVSIQDKPNLIYTGIVPGQPLNTMPCWKILENNFYSRANQSRVISLVERWNVKILARVLWVTNESVATKMSWCQFDFVDIGYKDVRFIIGLV